MALDIVRLLGGGVLLYFGAEWLVGGAAGLARAMRVSSLLIGLTVVAYGTSTPEVIVGIEAAVSGRGDIALGNVIGSNIANLGLILGACTLVRPAKVEGALVRREIPVLVVTALLVPLLLLGAAVHRWEGALLVVAAIGYTWIMVRGARGPAASTDAAADAAITEQAAESAGAPKEPSSASKSRLGAVALAGLVALMIGGHFFVEGAVGVAESLGMSERVVGLTIVAIGTSLPELATSIIAAWRGHSEIAVGNVVGSNVFNVLLCLGGASVAGEITVPGPRIWIDVGAMVALTLLGAFMMRTERTVTRIEGGVLLAAYAGFLAAVALVP